MKIETIINFYFFTFLAPSFSKQHSIFMRFLFRLSAASYFWGRGGFPGHGGPRGRGGRGEGNARRGGFGDGRGSLGGGQGLAI